MSLLLHYNFIDDVIESKSLCRSRKTTTVVNQFRCSAHQSIAQQPVRVSLVIVTVRLPSDVSNEVKIYFSKCVLSWKFILSLVIWHDILFQVNKTSKLMQTCGFSIDVVKTKIHGTQSFLKDYRQTECQNPGGGGWGDISLQQF